MSKSNGPEDKHTESCTTNSLGMMKSAEISSLQRSEVQKPCEGYGWKTLGVWEDGSDVYTQTGEHCGTKDTSSKQENMTLPN